MEGESATLLILFLANAGIANCADQIYPSFVPPNDRLMWVPDCEELSGGLLTGDDGVGFMTLSN